MKRAMVLMALVSMPLLADDVYLRGGGQITGEIVERTEESVKVDIGGGTMTVRMSTVVRIEEGTSPLQEYRELAADLPDGDVEGWRELARWAEDRALATQAREAWSEVAARVPDDPEANRALGRVELEGRWVTEEESYLARGYVEFEGEWMSPGERQAILDERRNQEQADRQALDAQIQALEAAAQEREAQQASEDAEFWEDNLSDAGGMVYWDWGTGPVAWPYPQAPQPRPARPATLPARGQR